MRDRFLQSHDLRDAHRWSNSGNFLPDQTARKHALDPLLSGDDLKLARCEMDDAAFKQDRLREAGTRSHEAVVATGDSGA